MKVTIFLNIKAPQNKLDFINIDVENDSSIYINPNMISNSTYSELRKNGEATIQSFFDYVFNLYSKGYREKAINNLFDYSTEDNSNHLGLSKGKSKGKGMSKRALMKLFDELKSDGSLSSEYISNPETIIVLTPGLGPDFMSDLLLSILKRYFVNYTLMQARILGLKLEPQKISYGKYWDYKSLEWKEIKDFWIKGPNGKPILLTPKQIVSEDYAFSVDSYIQNIILTWRQQFHLDNKTDLVRVTYDKYGDPIFKVPSKKEIRRKEIDQEFSGKNKLKEYALAMTKKNPSLFKQYIDQYSGRGLTIKDHILPDYELDKITSKNK